MPPVARTAAGRSEAGSAWASEPPRVPRWRTWGSPTVRATAPSSGASAATRSAVRQVVVPRARADRQLVALDAEVAQLGQPPDVDHQLGRGQAQLHHRQQRVATGEDLGVLAVLGQQRQRAIECVGPLVGEARPGSRVAPAVGRSPARPRRPRRERARRDRGGSRRPGRCPGPARTRRSPRARCCGSPCSGRGCPPAPRGSPARWASGSRRAGRPPPSPCPACRSRTAGRARRGTRRLRGAGRRCRRRGLRAS